MSHPKGELEIERHLHHYERGFGLAGSPSGTNTGTIDFYIGMHEYHI